MLPNQTPNAETDRLLKFLLHFGFLVSGTMTVLIGQVLPVLSNRLSLDDTQAANCPAIRFRQRDGAGIFGDAGRSFGIEFRFVASVSGSFRRQRFRHWCYLAVNQYADGRIESAERHARAKFSKFFLGCRRNFLPAVR